MLNDFKLCLRLFSLYEIGHSKQAKQKNPGQCRGIRTAGRAVQCMRGSPSISIRSSFDELGSPEFMGRISLHVATQIGCGHADFVADLVVVALPFLPNVIGFSRKVGVAQF